MSETTSTRSTHGNQAADYWFMNVGEETRKLQRQWEDSHRYGFLVAGGGPRWIAAARSLRVGDHVFAYLVEHGFVGLAEVSNVAVPFNEFQPVGQAKALPDLPLVSKLETERLLVPEKTDWCVGVRWLKAVPRSEAVLKKHYRRQTLCRIRTPAVIAELLCTFS